MSGWTSAEPDSEDVADDAGEHGALPCARGVADEEAEPAAVANSLTPPCAGGVPDDEEDPEAAAAADSPAPPCAAIHSHGPVDATLS